VGVVLLFVWEYFRCRWVLGDGCVGGFSFLFVSCGGVCGIACLGSCWGRGWLMGRDVGGVFVVIVSFLVGVDLWGLWCVG